MPKYTSCTGKNAILNFKGTEIIIPANGYYETSAEDLVDLFPDHVQKVTLPEIIEKIEKRLMPPNTNTILINKPITITKPIIHEIKPPKIDKIILNSPIELLLSPIKEVILKDEIHENIIKIINNSMSTVSDPDLNEFLGMIRDILSN